MGLYRLVSQSVNPLQRPGVFMRAFAMYSERTFQRARGGRLRPAGNGWLREVTCEESGACRQCYHAI